MDNKNSGNKGKKKPIITTKMSLTFPFRYEYKVIQDTNLVEFIGSRVKILREFNMLSKKSVKMGFNSCIKIIEDEKLKEEEKIIFFFLEKGIEILLDMLLLKVKSNKKIKLFVIDKEYKPKILEVLKLKKIISFSIIKNNVNEQVFNQLLERLRENANENLDLIYNSDSLVREYILHKDKK